MRRKTAKHMWSNRKSQSREKHTRAKPCSKIVANLVHMCALLLVMMETRIDEASEELDQEQSECNKRGIDGVESSMQQVTLNVS